MTFIRRHRTVQSTLSLFRLLRAVNLLSFYSALLAMAIGIALVCAGVEWHGTSLIFLGGILLAILLAEAYLMLPRLECPRCQNPFFVPRGWAGILFRINPPLCLLETPYSCGVKELRL